VDAIRLAEWLQAVFGLSFAVLLLVLFFLVVAAPRHARAAKLVRPLVFVECVLLVLFASSLMVKPVVAAQAVQAPNPRR
jgi:hypothetical protein